MGDPADVLWLHGSRHDPDRIGPAPSAMDLARARFNGRYPIDEFGGDPQLQDLFDPLLDLSVAVRVIDSDRIPSTGSAAFVANRGFGMLEPIVLANAVRRSSGRHLRVAGVPSLPLMNTLSRKLGLIGADRADVGACLRLGHLVALPLGRTWVRQSAGTPPVDLLLGALGHRVYPVAIRPGGPLGLPLLPWVVQVGEMIRLDAGEHPIGDPLAAAELADRLRGAVDDLLSQPV